MNKKTILIVGGAGFLGSVLSKKLLNKGYTVKVLDNLMYGGQGLKELKNYDNFEFIFGDARDIRLMLTAITDVDAVVHLAALVGDPACNLNQKETIGINHLTTKIIAEVCKYYDIKRFIFASSCSVYGASKDKDSLLTETSATNPVSLYAELKLKSEDALLEMADDNFKPTVLRMATLHGISDRMRFDLVVNVLTINALFKGEFSIFGGSQHRALCHIDDAADAYVQCIEAPLDKVGSNIFNITSENMSITELGNIVKEEIPTAKMKFKGVDDLRDYVVSSEKASKTFGFKQKRTVRDTIREIKNKAFMYEDFTHRKYSNIRFLEGMNNESI
jgi:nucleoside-diphosphate-sugar epimerase